MRAVGVNTQTDNNKQNRGKMNGSLNCDDQE